MRQFRMFVLRKLKASAFPVLAVAALAMQLASGPVMADDH